MLVKDYFPTKEGNIVSLKANSNLATLGLLALEISNLLTKKLETINKKILLIILSVITLISCGEENTINPSQTDDDYYLKINFAESHEMSPNLNWYFDGITSISPNKRMFFDYGDIVNIRQIDFWGKINYGSIELGYFRFQEFFDKFGCLKKVEYIGDIVERQFIYDDEKYLKMLIISPSFKKDTIKFYRNGTNLNKIHFTKSNDYITFNYEGKNIINETYFKAGNYKYSINYIYEHNILKKKIYKDKADLDSVTFEYNNNNLVKANYYNLKFKYDDNYNYKNPSYSRYQYENNMLINEQDDIDILFSEDNHIYGKSKWQTYNYYYENNLLHKYSSKWSYSNNKDTYIIYEFKK